MGIASQPLSQAKLAILRALSDRKGREKHGLFIAEGVRLERDALAMGWKPELLVADADALNGPLRKDIRELMAAGGFIAEPSVFTQFSDTVNSQGIVAAFKLPDSSRIEPLLDAVKDGGAILVLDNVRDPGNAGTILRTAAAFGCKAAVLVKGCADPFSQKTVRASMGGVFALPLCTGKGVDELAAAFEKSGLNVYPMDAVKEGGDWPPPRDGKPVFVVGGETEGLSPGWQQQAKAIVHIPQSPKIDSLNASIAAAVCLARWYEQSRDSG